MYVYIRVHLSVEILIVIWLENVQFVKCKKIFTAFGIAISRVHCIETKPRRLNQLRIG